MTTDYHRRLKAAAANPPDAALKEDQFPLGPLAGVVLTGISTKVTTHFDDQCDKKPKKVFTTTEWVQPEAGQFSERNLPEAIHCLPQTDVGKYIQEVNKLMAWSLEASLLQGGRRFSSYRYGWVESYGVSFNILQTACDYVNWQVARLAADIFLGPEYSWSSGSEEGDYRSFEARVHMAKVAQWVLSGRTARSYQPRYDEALHLSAQAAIRAGLAQHSRRQRPVSTPKSIDDVLERMKSQADETLTSPSFAEVQWVRENEFASGWLADVMDGLAPVVATRNIAIKLVQDQIRWARYNDDHSKPRDPATLERECMQLLEFASRLGDALEAFLLGVMNSHSGKVIVVYNYIHLEHASSMLVQAVMAKERPSDGRREGQELFVALMPATLALMLNLEDSSSDCIIVPAEPGDDLSTLSELLYIITDVNRRKLAFLDVEGNYRFKAGRALVVKDIARFWNTRGGNAEMKARVAEALPTARRLSRNVALAHYRAGGSYEMPVPVECAVRFPTIPQHPGPAPVVITPLAGKQG